MADSQYKFPRDLEVERDTLIAIPLFIFMGIMLQRHALPKTCW